MKIASVACRISVQAVAWLLLFATVADAAEIALQQISELLPVKGIEYVGALPSEIQKVTVFSAAIAAGAKGPEAARALLQFLASAAAAPAIAKSALEPLAK